MRHPVRDLLYVVNLEIGRVGNGDVVCRRHCALPHVLADEEEILPNQRQNHTEFSSDCCLVQLESGQKDSCRDTEWEIQLHNTLLKIKTK